MKFTNEGSWFYFDDDNPEEGGVCLRSLSLGDLEEIRKKTVTKHSEYRRPDKKTPLQRFEWEETNESIVQEMQWIRMIVDWKNVEVEDETGQVVCTDENKIKLMRKYPDFAAFVAKCINKLVEDLPTEEDLAKN